MMCDGRPWALGTTKLRVGGVGDPTRLFPYTFRRVTGSKFIMHDTKLMLGDAFCYVMMGE